MPGGCVQSSNCKTEQEPKRKRAVETGHLGDHDKPADASQGRACKEGLQKHDLCGQ